MGIGVFSSPVQQRMPPAVPARPVQPRILEISSHFLDIFWTEPDPYGARVRYYEMRVRGGDFSSFDDCPPIRLEKDACQKRAQDRRSVQKARVAVKFAPERQRHEAEMQKVRWLAAPTTTPPFAMCGAAARCHHCASRLALWLVPRVRRVLGFKALLCATNRINVVCPLVQAERFSESRRRRVKARIASALNFMHRRMEDELAKQLILDEDFGMPAVSE